LNGKLIQCYRDTGANLSVCRTRLVPTFAYTGECVEIRNITNVGPRYVSRKANTWKSFFLEETVMV